MTDECVQDLVSPWWRACDLHPLQRGQVVKAFVPHVDLVPYTLSPEGRAEAHDHTRANFKIEQLRIHTRKTSPTLPVAALPALPGEAWTVHRSKVRPALVISVGGPEIPRGLRPSSSPKWQSAPTLLVAPYYGTQTTENRAGWYGPFLERIRACEYPQFMLDRIPGASVNSVLRLDHIQPIGRHQDSFEPLPHRLSDDALLVLDEWVAWLQTGDLPDSASLHDVRSHLMKQASAKRPF